MARLACTITVEGQLDDRLHDAFGTLSLTTAHGRSQLTGTVADQAELQGLLRRLYDLGLEVVSFTSDAGKPPPTGPPIHPGD
jgi:hypothetical protein